MTTFKDILTFLFTAKENLSSILLPGWWEPQGLQRLVLSIILSDDHVVVPAAASGLTEQSGEHDSQQRPNPGGTKVRTEVKHWDFEHCSEETLPKTLF